LRTAMPAAIQEEAKRDVLKNIVIVPIPAKLRS
jgi:hypothetical protein